MHNHTEVHLAGPRLTTSPHDRGYASAIAPAIDDMARRMLEAGAARLLTEHGDSWLPVLGEHLARVIKSDGPTPER